jgi:hypothetical protein
VWFTLCETFARFVDLQRANLYVSEIDELWEQKECSQICPYYLDIQGEQVRLQARSSHSLYMQMTFAKGGVVVSLALSSDQFDYKYQRTDRSPRSEKTDQNKNN